MRPRLPDDLVDGLEIHDATPVSGGDIADAYRIETPDGPLFCKTSRHPTPAMFAREADGLRELREHVPDWIGVPQVVRESDSGLVLEWIELRGRRSSETEATLGRGLAHLHRTTNATFGGLGTEKAGYIGSMPVDLTPTTDWPEFYLTRRLRPLVEAAVQAGSLDPDARQVLDRLEPRVADLCGPTEPPALVHGDLWAGNRVVDTAGRNWLIDPACHYAHREIDLAMMHLFGGFGPEAFAAYDEHHPLGEGWRERIEWYQLVPLLAHAVLFGGGYGVSALSAMRRYA